MDMKQTPNPDPTQLPAGGNGDAGSPRTPEPPKPSADADVQAGTQAQSLAAIKELTGRDFASLEEAKKHYQGLNSLVGDNAVAEARERAKKLDGLARKIAQENSWSVEAAYAFIDKVNAEGGGAAGVGSPDKTSFDPKQAETDARIRRMERELFLAKRPEAQAVMAQLDEYASATGKPLAEAFESLYGGVVDQVRDSVRSDALRMEKKGAGIPASTSAPLPPEPDLYAKNMEMYQKTGKKEFFHEAIKHRWDKNAALKRKVESGG